MIRHCLTKSRSRQLLFTAGLLASATQMAHAGDFVLENNEITWLSDTNINATVRSNGVSSQVDLSAHAPISAIPDISFALENVEDLNTSGSSDLRLFIEVNNRLGKDEIDELEILLGVIRVQTEDEKVSSVEFISNRSDEGYERTQVLGRHITNGRTVDLSEDFTFVPDLVSTTNNRVTIAVRNLASAVSGDTTLDALIDTLTSSEALHFTVGLKSSGGIPSVFGTFYDGIFHTTNITPDLNLAGGAFAQEFENANYFEGATLLFREVPPEKIVDKYDLAALQSNNAFFSNLIDDATDSGSSLSTQTLSAINTLMREADDIVDVLVSAVGHPDRTFEVSQIMEALLATSTTSDLAARVGNTVASASTDNITQAAKSLMDQTVSTLFGLVAQLEATTVPLSQSQKTMASDVLGNLATTVDKLAKQIVAPGSDQGSETLKQLRLALHSAVAASNELKVPVSEAVMKKFSTASRSLAGNVATFVPDSIASQVASPLTHYPTVSANKYNNALSSETADFMVSSIRLSGALNKTNVALSNAPNDSASVNTLIDSAFSGSSYTQDQARYTLQTDDETLVMRTLALKAIPLGMDSQSTLLADGRMALVSNDGYAIEMAPAPVDLFEFAKALDGMGFIPAFRDNGSFELTLSASESFSGAFAYDNLDSADLNESCGPVNFAAPTAAPQDPAAVFTVTCEDSGVSQRIVPFAAQAELYSTLQTLDLQVSTDRDTGVITVAGIGRFKPSFFVSESRTEAEIDSYLSNKGNFGIVLETADFNSDGLIDIKIIDSSSVQIMYGVAAS